MRIAFWGNEAGSGTTSNMCIISELFLWRAKKMMRSSKNPMEQQQIPEFIDCACRTDERTKRLLRGADLVVVNAKPSRQMLDRFFLELPGVSKNSFFLIGSYYQEGHYNKAKMVRRYRIPEGQIGFIPYNPEFGYACDCGKQKEFMRAQRKQIYKYAKGSEQTREFFREIQQTADALQKILNQIKEEK